MTFATGSFSIWERGAKKRELFNETANILLDRRSFRPFTIALADGDRHKVDQPYSLAFRDGVVVFAEPGGVPHIIDHESVSHVIEDSADRT